MHKVRRAAAFAFAIGATLVTGACGSADDSGKDQPSDPTPYPSGAVVVVPSEALPGAERIEVDGVGIDIMADYVSQSAGNQPEQTAVQIGREGGIAVLTLTVTRQSHAATDDDVDVGFYFYQQSGQGLRGMTDCVEIPVAWDVVAHPVGLDAVEPSPTVPVATCG